MKKKKKEKAHIDIELPYEAGEVIVLEVLWKQFALELSHVRYDEAIAVRTPRNQGIRGLIVDHLVAFQQKRRNQNAIID